MRYRTCLLIGVVGVTLTILEQRLLDWLKVLVFSVWEYPSLLYRSYRLDRSLAGIAMNKMRIPAIEAAGEASAEMTSRKSTMAADFEGSCIRWFRMIGLISRGAAAKSYANKRPARLDTRRRCLHFRSGVGDGSWHLRRRQRWFCSWSACWCAVRTGKELGVLY